MPLIAGKQLRDGTITATQVDTDSGTISTINAGDAAAEGVGEGLSRRDHQHEVATASGVSLDANSTNTEGASSYLARSDHTHYIDSVNGTISIIEAGDSSAEGTGTGFSRRDHQHAVSTGAAVGIVATDTEGNSTTLARANHTHKLQELQENVTTEAISGDTALADTLDNVPRTGSTVRLYLNGVQQQYGAGKDFTVSSQTITWLAASGTAVNLAADDVLVAVYST
jgi:hypothetical protein